MTTYAIELMDLGFILTLGACWAALLLVAFAATAIRHAVAGASHASRGLTTGHLDA